MSSNEQAGDGTTASPAVGSGYFGALDSIMQTVIDSAIVVHDDGTVGPRRKENFNA